MARLVASKGDKPSAMFRSTFSNDNDGVVHHDANGQDQAEQGEGIDAEAQGEHGGKRADE